MNTVNCPTTRALQLTELLAARIRERAGSRLRGVEVSRCDGNVVIQGRADSYYACQLAIAACQTVLNGRNDLRLDCRFDVD